LYEAAVGELPNEMIEAQLHEVMERRRDPHSAVEELIGSFRQTGKRG
jgi:hypothetical protein